MVWLGSFGLGNWSFLRVNNEETCRGKAWEWSSIHANSVGVWKSWWKDVGKSWAKRGTIRIYDAGYIIIYVYMDLWYIIISIYGFVIYCMIMYDMINYKAVCGIVVELTIRRYPQTTLGCFKMGNAFQRSWSLDQTWVLDWAFAQVGSP